MYSEEADLNQEHDHTNSGTSGYELHNSPQEVNDSIDGEPVYEEQDNSSDSDYVHSPQTKNSSTRAVDDGEGSEECDAIRLERER